MKRILLSTLALSFCIAISVQSQTYLSGSLSGTLASGDYWVNGPIWIDSGASLDIQPGARLTFLGYYRFDISGTLTAVGTEADSIIFENDPQNSAGWHGLRFPTSESSGSLLAYCRISGGIGVGSGFEDQGGGIYCNEAALTFQHCLISDNSSLFYGGGVYLNNAPATFENCVITNNSTSYLGGGICGFTSDITLDHCEISYNYAESGGGLYASEGVLSVQNTAFSYNDCSSSGGGLNLSGIPTAMLENCLIEHNSANGT